MINLEKKPSSKKISGKKTRPILNVSKNEFRKQFPSASYSGGEQTMFLSNEDWNRFAIHEYGKARLPFRVVTHMDQMPTV